MNDSDKYKIQLLQAKAEILSVQAQTKEAHAPVALDQTTQGRLSRMDALQQQAMGKENQRRRAIQLKRIDAALARIEAGEFGFCIMCGTEIDPTRLEHIS